MNDDEHQEATREHHLVDSLLQTIYGGHHSSAQDLVTDGMEAIGLSEPSIAGQLKPAMPVSRWFIGAVVLVVLVFAISFMPNLDPSRAATAAVSRSLQQSLVDVGRQYQITTRFRAFIGGPVTRKMELYVKGGDQFALRIPGPLKNHATWIGSDRGQAWVVPMVGPVIKGGPDSLLSWMSNRKPAETPYLHVRTVLERLQNDFQLNSIEDAVIDVQGQDVLCHYVVGELVNQQDRELPNRVELWADQDSGVAMQVNLRWNEGRGHRESISLSFVRQKNLDDTFFVAESHGGVGRMVVQFSDN